MADKKLPRKAPILHLERGEFEHLRRTLEGIQSRASNLLAIAEAVDIRADNEFAESMRIIRGLPPEMIDLLKLSEYGGRLVEIDDRIAVELVDPNDNARRRFQYRREGDGIVQRVLLPDGRPFEDGSPWEPVNLAAMRAVRGTYHPILDTLGL